MHLALSEILISTSGDALPTVSEMDFAVGLRGDVDRRFGLPVKLLQIQPDPR